MTRADISDYLKIFYNRIRSHSHFDGMSPKIKLNISVVKI